MNNSYKFGKCASLLLLCSNVMVFIQLCNYRLFLLAESFFSAMWKVNIWTLTTVKIQYRLLVYWLTEGET